MRLALITLIAVSAVSAHGSNGNQAPHRRHATGQAIVERAALVQRAGTGWNDTAEAASAEAAAMRLQSSVPTSTAAAASSAAITSASAQASVYEDAPSGKAGDTVTPTSQVVESSVAPTSSAAPEAQSSAAPVEQAVQPSSEAPAYVAPVSSAAPIEESAVNSAPATLSSVPVSAATVLRVTQTKPAASYVTMTRTASSNPSGSAAAANGSTEEKKGGLSKLAMIIIIVVASVVGIAAIAVFAIRKWKLRPSNRFDERLKPINFSPYNDGMEEVFLEKTHHRTASTVSADRQRQQFVKELEADPNYVDGIPDHDFTAPANNAGYGAYSETYNNDPFARAEAYEYDQDDYYRDQPDVAYPPAAAQMAFPANDMRSQDYPTQDQTEEGYANLQRGNSTGSDHARHVQTTAFPSPDTYLGRPTGGFDGPYSQAAQYRY